MARARHEQIPSASSPQLLTRLLELIARGVRSTRGLQEALGVEPRTVQYYTQAGQWLGLLEADDTSALTPLGVDYVYAGSQRAQVYAEAVWSQPLAAKLMAGGVEPRLEDCLAAVLSAEPEVSPATARRRASALRTLIAPAVGRQPGRSPHQEAMQLALPLSMAPTSAPAPKLPLTAGTDWNPDVYRYVLGALLDYGELTLGQVRALLDRAGADQVPIGGYVDMAIARGDASRRTERLVVSDDAIARRELVDSTNSIILSDPAYRTYLDDSVVAASGDRRAEIRRDQVAGRFRLWDQRVFGHPIRPELVLQDLERILMDRSLASFPMATRTAPERHPVVDPFLDAWDSHELAIACPPYLAQLQGGLAGVNAVLRKARQGGSEVGMPDLSTRPVAVHGGLMHPGEPLPRTVPDMRSLRLRTLLCSPYPALISAVFLLHRQRSDRVEVVRGADGWELKWGRKRLGSLLRVLDRFGRSRGWAVARRPGGLDGGALIRSLEALGVAWVAGKRAVLEERFFGQLRRQPEEFEIFERLQPLATAIDDWLDGEGGEAVE